MHAEERHDFQAARRVLVEQRERSGVVKAGAQRDVRNVELRAQGLQQVDLAHEPLLDQDLAEPAPDLLLHLHRLLQALGGDRAVRDQYVPELPAGFGARRLGRRRASVSPVSTYAENPVT